MATAHFLGGPCHLSTRELDELPARIATSELDDGTAYVLDADGHTYTWHIDAPAQPAAEPADEDVEHVRPAEDTTPKQTRPRARRGG